MAAGFSSLLQALAAAATGMVTLALDGNLPEMGLREWGVFVQLLGDAATSSFMLNYVIGVLVWGLPRRLFRGLRDADQLRTLIIHGLIAFTLVDLAMVYMLFSVNGGWVVEGETIYDGLFRGLFNGIVSGLVWAWVFWYMRDFTKPAGGFQ